MNSLKDKVVDLIIRKGDPYSFENDENFIVEKLVHRIDSVGIQFQVCYTNLIVETKRDANFYGKSACARTSIAITLMHLSVRNCMQLIIAGKCDAPVYC